MFANMESETGRRRMRRRPHGTFVDVVPRNTSLSLNDMAVGTQFYEIGDIGGAVPLPINCDPNDDPPDAFPMVVRVQHGFKFQNYFECSTLSRNAEDLDSITAEAFEAIVSELLTRATLEGLGDVSVDPQLPLSLLDGYEITTLNSDIDAVVIDLEWFLQSVASNTEGVVFVPQHTIPALVAANVVRIDNGIYVTNSGHRVVFDAGHTAEYNNGDDMIAFITSGIDWNIADSSGNPRPEWDLTNTERWFREAVGIVRFNLAHSGWVEFDAPAPPDITATPSPFVADPRHTA